MSKHASILSICKSSPPLAPVQSQQQKTDKRTSMHDSAPVHSAKSTCAQLRRPQSEPSMQIHGKSTKHGITMKYAVNSGQGRGENADSLSLWDIMKSEQHQSTQVLLRNEERNGKKRQR